MKSRMVSKSVLIIGLIIAVCLAVFAIKIRYSQINNLPSTPESTATPTPVATTQPSPVSDTKLRKRPVGTENWLQYTDQKNKVAFLYPSGFVPSVMEVREAKLDLSISPASPIRQNSVISLFIEESTLKKSINTYLNTELNPGWKAKFVALDDVSIDKLIFKGYLETHAYQGKEINGYFVYFGQRNEDVIELTLQNNPESSVNNSLFLKSILLDGTRFED